MADFVFNIAKGKAGYYATLPATNDALIIVAIETTGIEADATLKDHDTLAALLAGTSNEQTTVGRKTISSGLTLTVDDSADTFNFDVPDQTYTTPTGNAISAFVVCYDPDTTAGTDSDLIPLTKHDRTWTPDGNTAVLQFASGVYTAS